MRLHFVYSPQLNGVDYTADMDLHETFGEAIDSMCTYHGWHTQDWDFMFHALFHLPRDWTSDGMGAHNADEMTIYCRLAIATN